jgi:hypothetical protein
MINYYSCLSYVFYGFRKALLQSGRIVFVDKTSGVTFIAGLMKFIIVVNTPVLSS